MKRKKSKKWSGLLLMISLVSLAPTMTYAAGIAAGIVEVCAVAVAGDAEMSAIGDCLSRRPYFAAAVGAVGVACGVLVGIDWLVWRLYLRDIDQFFDGATSGDECALLQVIKPAAAYWSLPVCLRDVERAADLVISYHFARLYRCVCCKANNSSLDCDCRERSKSSSIKAIESLDCLFSALDQKEKNLRETIPSWLWNTFFLEDRLYKFGKIKKLISEVIKVIRKRKLYQEQLKTHE